MCPCSFNYALKNVNSNNTINDISDCLFKVGISNNGKQHGMIQIIKSRTDKIYCPVYLRESTASASSDPA